MLPYFSETFGNPSSVHFWGQQAEAALESSRSTVASLLGAAPNEIIFTSGGTESDNLALRGAAFAERKRRRANRILTSPVEHPAVNRTAAQLAQVHGFQWDTLPVDRFGMVSPDDLRRVLTPDTAVVSVIYANNEIGTINPIPELAAAAHEAGVPLHSDAVQAPAYLSVNVRELQADMISLGAHKFYGPKGIGALYVRRGVGPMPILTGGSQESGMRPGTSNVPLIVGLRQALSVASEERASDVPRLCRLRDRLLDEVPRSIAGTQVTGHSQHRLPNHASFVFEGIEGNQLLAALDVAGYGCSSGSACKTGEPEPSEVLLALGLTPQLALGSLRVTVGRSTSEDDIGSFLSALPAVVGRLRHARF
jgi:cysteine desulfurase